MKAARISNHKASDVEEVLSKIELPQHPLYDFVLGEDLTMNELPVGQAVWVAKSKGKGNAQELFLRAKILSKEDNDRYMVQYPAGSSYSVRREYLHPILDRKKLVIVWPETPIYRRSCIVQTLPHEIFLEIGCAFGVTTQKIQETGNDDRLVIGVDKSTECITEAKKRYDKVLFLEWDVLEAPWPTGVKEKPSIVAIDINGNRELPAVLDCLKIVFDWNPRLIVVKSRSLYLRLKTKS